MSFQSERDSFRAGWEGRVGAQIARMIAGDIGALRGSGILDHAARPGQRMPATGNRVDRPGKAFLAPLTPTRSCQGALRSGRKRRG